MTDATDQPGDGPSRAEREEDLRATSDAIQAEVGGLVELEQRKESLPPGDPEVDELSDAAVSVADDIARKTRVERELTDELR